MTKKISNTLEIIILFIVLILTGVGLFLIYFFFSASIASFILVAAYVLNALIGTHLMISGRHNHAKVSWFYIIIIFPIIGPLVYFMFGQRYKYRMSTNQKMQLYTPFLNAQEDLSIKPDNFVLQQTSNLSKRKVSNGDIEFLNGGDKAFSRMFDEMRNAKKYLNVMYYILKQGEIYQEFESILISKVKEGVEVRLILDDFGIWAMPWRKIRFLEESGIKIQRFGRIYFPFVGSVNGYRIHRKMVIVDGKVAFTGGLNISDEYAHLSKKYGYWADMHARLTGNIVRQLDLLFLQDWYMISKENLIDTLPSSDNDVQPNANIVVVDSGPDNIEPLLENLLVKWILSAKKSIKITTPYFVPTSAVMNALITAAMSGVDVQILIPNKPDKPIVLMSSKYYARPLIEAGVKFYWMNKTLVHTKIGIFDGEFAYLGSMNVDIRSFYSQFEIQLLIEGNKTNELEKIFDNYLTKSLPIALKKERVIFRWLKAIIIKTFSPLM